METKYFNTFLKCKECQQAEVKCVVIFHMNFGITCVVSVSVAFLLLLKINHYYYTVLAIQNEVFNTTG